MADQPTTPPNGNGAALDADLTAEFERLLRSPAFRAEVIEWIDADSEHADRTRILADRLRRVARAVFEKPH